MRLYTRTARRARSRYGLRPTGVLGPLDPRPVFVVGCPRSGTTFTAKSIGRVQGFADLGEVGRLKAAIPELHAAVSRGESPAVVTELRTIMRTSQRAAMARRSRAIEQTPESTFLIEQLAEAFPRAHFVHLLRDGRDVVSSLVERGWLAGDAGALVPARDGEDVDETGRPFGGYARFWVEEDRAAEFEAADEARRCAWAWRRYVTAALQSLGSLDPERVTTVRYEDLVGEPNSVAVHLATGLGESSSTAQFAGVLASAHAGSVGRFAQRLTDDQLRAVHDEAGTLLGSLGYLDGQPPSAHGSAVSG